ncbi:hypothetical protein FQN54_009540 [Arachnomyces sp. PD_36]|nr:hypothetical protein FQN54_009540 [Arachnomyces sp. PD_36]
MGLSPHQILSIVVIICFVPAAAIAGWLCIARGIGHHWGWLYLLVLALARVVGCSLQIAAGETGIEGLFDAAVVLSSSGLMALILVMLEIIHRVKQRWLTTDPIPLLLWRVLHWSQWAAFILSIIATADSNDGLWKAAVILMAVMFAGQTFISIVFSLQIKQLLGYHDRVIIILLSSIPFLMVRVLYAILHVFVTSGSVFGGERPNVVAVALMQYLMEFIAVAMYLAAGFLVTSWKGGEPEADEEELRMVKSRNGDR